MVAWHVKLLAECWVCQTSAFSRKSLTTTYGAMAGEAVNTCHAVSRRSPAGTTIGPPGSPF